MMFMMLFMTVLLGTGLYAAVKFYGGHYPVYGSLSQITFYVVTAIYLWHLIVKGRR